MFMQNADPKEEEIQLYTSFYTRFYLHECTSELKRPSLTADSEAFRGRWQRLQRTLTIGGKL